MNLVNSDQSRIVITLFRQIQHHSEFRLLLNLSEKCDYNRNFVWINKINHRQKNIFFAVLKYTQRNRFVINFTFKRISSFEQFPFGLRPKRNSDMFIIKSKLSVESFFIVSGDEKKSIVQLTTCHLSQLMTCRLPPSPPQKEPF